MNLQNYFYRWGLWFNPFHRLKTLCRWTMYVGVPIAAIGAGAAGWWANQRYDATYAGSCVLRYMPEATVLELNPEGQSYRPPQFSQHEVGTWLYQWPLYETIYPQSGRSDGVKVLKQLISIDHREQVGHFILHYSGAHSAGEVAATLDTFAAVAMADGHERVLSLIDQDLNLAQQQLTQQQAATIISRQKLADFATQHEFVDAEVTLLRINDRIHQARSKSADATLRLQQAQHLLTSMPDLIAAQPREVPGARSSMTERSLRRDRLRTELAELTSLYTEQNPMVLAKRDELAAAEQEVMPGQPADQTDLRFDRNPTLDALDQQRVDVVMALPDLRATAEWWQQELIKAQQDLAALPVLRQTLQHLRADLSHAEATLRVLQQRHDEIVLARRLARSPLTLAAPFDQQYVQEKSKLMKLVMVMGAAFAGLLAGWLCYAVIRLVLHRRIQHPADLAVAFGCPPSRCCIDSLVGGTSSTVHDRDTGRDNRWIRQTIQSLTSNVLVILHDRDSQAAAVHKAECILQHVAQSGQRSLLLSPHHENNLARSVEASGANLFDLSDVLSGGVSADQACIAPTSGIEHLTMGNCHRLADLAVHGRYEHFLTDSQQHFDLTVVVLEQSEEILLQQHAELGHNIAVVLTSSQLPRAQRYDNFHLARQLRLQEQKAVFVHLDAPCLIAADH